MANTLNKLGKKKLEMGSEVRITVYFSTSEAEKIRRAAIKTQRRERPKMATYIALAALTTADNDLRK